MTSKQRKKRKRSSGLPGPELHYLTIGRVKRAHGLRGELSVIVLTDFPERFEITESVYLAGQPYRLESYRWHQKNILLSLRGITDRSQAEQFKGELVQIPVEEAMPLPDGVYYLYQLIGLQMVTTAGQPLGTVVDIIETGANDVYVVEQEGRELLIPATDEVVQAVDLEQGRITVRLIEGLI